MHKCNKGAQRVKFSKQYRGVRYIVFEGTFANEIHFISFFMTSGFITNFILSTYKIILLFRNTFSGSYVTLKPNFSLKPTFEI